VVDSWDTWEWTVAPETCCGKYVNHCMDCIHDWLICTSWERNKPDTLFECIGDTLAILKRINEGEPCPWHDDPADGLNYLAVMNMMGAGTDA
jgi:hypothetical protein